MAETKKQPEKKKKGISIPIVSAVLSTSLKMITVSILAGFICLVAEVVMYGFHLNDGYKPALNRFQENINHLAPENGWLDAESIIKGVDAKAKKQYSTLAQYLSNKTEEIAGLTRIETPTRGKFNFLDNAKRTFQKVDFNFNDLIIIWYVVTMTYVLKMLLLFSMLPVFLMVAAVAIADSFAMRGIDTYRGKRTSQDRMEYWHYAYYSFFYLVPFSYIAIPNSYNAFMFMLPYTLVSGFLLRQTVREYKKYI